MSSGWRDPWPSESFSPIQSTGQHLLTSSSSSPGPAGETAPTDNQKDNQTATCSVGGDLFALVAPDLNGRRCRSANYNDEDDDKQTLTGGSQSQPQTDCSRTNPISLLDLQSGAEHLPGISLARGAECAELNQLGLGPRLAALSAVRASVGRALEQVVAGGWPDRAIKRRPIREEDAERRGANLNSLITFYLARPLAASEAASASRSQFFGGGGTTITTCFRSLPRPSPFHLLACYARRHLLRRL